MKSYKFILIPLFLIFSEMKADSTLQVLKPLRKKKNIIEYSLNSLNLFDRQGYKLTDPIYNFSYTRFIYKQYFAKIEYFEYGRENIINYNKPYNELKRGDIEYTWFKVIKLNLGKKIEYKRFSLKPMFSLNHRWGFGELYFWDWRQNLVWPEKVNNLNKMNSLGFGLGSGVSHNIYKNFQIGLEYNFNYNLEKYKFITGGGITKEDSDAFNFKPNRKYSTLQLQLGYKF